MAIHCDQKQDVITQITTQMDDESMESLQEIIESLNQTHLQGLDTSFQQEFMKSVNESLNMSVNNTSFQFNGMQNFADEVNLS